MKDNYPKIFCTLIMSLALCSLKAQSLQQKHQKDMDLRKTQVNKVILKAKEQQLQQQAERTNTVSIAPATGTSNPVPLNNQVLPAQQQRNELRPQVTPTATKPKQTTTQQKASLIKVNTEQ